MLLCQEKVLPGKEVIVIFPTKGTPTKGGIACTPTP